MKKFIILTISLIITLFAYSQTFLKENFDEGMMPPSGGWTIDNFPTQWDCYYNNVADGNYPEARFSKDYTSGTTRFISPQIDLGGISSVVLRFKHYLDDDDHEGYTIGIATRSGGGIWNNVWTVNPTYNIGPEEIFLTISNSDVGSSDFQFCFFIIGTFTMLDYWHIDDISLFKPYGLDCELSKITTYPFIFDSSEIQGYVTNVGATSITSLGINYQVEEGEISTTTFSDINIDFGEKYMFQCADLFNMPKGAYSVKVWLSSVNGGTDDNTDNDTLVTDLSTISNTVYKRPMLEQFASSNSQTAAYANNYFNPWCEEREDSLTLLKYPWRYSLPDPYYIEESKARQLFYEFENWDDVYLYGNGEEVNLSVLWYLNQFFNTAKNEPGIIKVVANRTTVSRNSIMDIDVTILPFANFNKQRLLIGVFEKTTTGNVGNNGETSFKHILMDMVPDENGVAIDVDDRVPTTISQSIDLSGTFIEEWDDLGVAIFIQDFNTKEMFQSTYAIENAYFSSNANLIDLLVDGVSIEGFSHTQYEYNVELPVGTTIVPVTTGIPIDEEATVVELPVQELPGTTVMEVFAEDLTTKLIYTVNYTVLTSTDQQEYPDIKVYPNPTQGHLSISGVTNASVTLYSASGSQISTYDNYNGEAISLAAYPKGIYIARIQTDELSVTRRIVVR